MKPQVYMTTAELADHLRYAGPNRLTSAGKWIARHEIRKYWRGRCLLVRVADVEAVLAGEKRTEAA